MDFHVCSEETTIHIQQAEAIEMGLCKIMCLFLILTRRRIVFTLGTVSAESSRLLRTKHKSTPFP